MSYLKRLSVSLKSQVEQLVNQVEDHEAVVDAAIGDAKKTLASSRVRINRVRRDGSKLKRQIEEHSQAHTKWRNRAKQKAKEDEITALECLRRAQEAEQKVKNLQHLYAEHQVQQEQLQAIISDAEQRLQDKIQKRNLMSTKQSALQTSATIVNSESDRSENWDNAFERWETRIAEMEVSQELSSPADNLEYEFTTQERLDSLREDLTELMQEEKNND